MPEVKPPEFVVIMVPAEGEERFLLLDTSKMWSLGFKPFVEPGGTAERLALLERMFRELPQLTESELRARLAERGESPERIDAQLERARTRVDRVVTLAGSAPAFAFETITRIGYRNADGQEVVRRTDRMGPDLQRVFVMRCAVCGHEYGSYGCDADIRRCPACQDGAPGVPH